MSTATRRRADQLDDYAERLRLIRDALSVIDEERLLDAITDSDQGGLLRLVLDNIRRLAT